MKGERPENTRSTEVDGGVPTEGVSPVLAVIRDNLDRHNAIRAELFARSRPPPPNCNGGGDLKKGCTTAGKEPCVQLLARTRAIFARHGDPRHPASTAPWRLCELESLALRGW